ncbi:MAG: PorP/SprF family type IX secretion system membrane protein [Saprospiraceae bacterium]|nr:PorP/SprF family type IX secretion system membrane protein [Saprospiraceae bacterium]
MRSIITLIVLSFCSFLVQGQDPSFAQFYAAPLQVNPAMTGVHSGKFRVAINYRDQWSSVLDNDPYRTIGTSFDIRHRVGRSDYIAYGFDVMRDEAGPSNYTQTAAHLNLAFLKQLNGSRYRTNDQFLVAGAQVGFGQHALDYGNLWFSNQFDNINEEVNTTLSSGENISQNTSAFLDINAGLLYYALFGDNASLYLGGAMHHLNGPSISFRDTGSESIYMRWLVQAGGEIPFSTEMSLLPAVITQSQGPSLTTIVGANLRFTNRDWKEVAIRAGVWTQISNELSAGSAIPTYIVTAILEMGRVNLGLSYDVNAGTVAKPTNSRGAFEISLVYVHPGDRRMRVSCPKF